MSILEAVILGIVQGASELLPISSSAHLFLIPKILGWEGVVNMLSFDVALHLGTAVALIIFFWNDWWRLLLAFLRALPKGFSGLWKDTDARLFAFLIIGSLPAAAAGLAFKDFFADEARNLPLVATMLIFFGLLLLAADRLGRKQKGLEKITFVDTLSIGLAQAVALIPGVSRSGITITSALFRDIDRVAAVKFSFLLSTPAIVGAVLLESKDILANLHDSTSQGIFIAGFVAAALSSLLAIQVMLRFIQTNNFTIFVVYRVLLGLAVLAIAIGI